MNETRLYLQIAESIRREIVDQKLNPGDKLPSIREMTRRWNCTPGTVQRAYQELVRQNLVTSHVGQGTQVIGRLNNLQDISLRKVTLAHKADTFLFESVTNGFTIEEIEQSFQFALDHWKSIQSQSSVTQGTRITFFGSHDFALSWLSNRFSEIVGKLPLKINFVGSLGGLIALAEGKAQLAGCHLWDSESNSYNIPFIRKLLPEKRVALLTLAHRKLGLILPSGNPLHIQGLSDLTLPGIQFVNRQDGSGTRIWLDSNLRQLGIEPKSIQGYKLEKLTHSDVAQVIAEGEANAGIGLEIAALSYGLDFIFLTLEKYDLVFFAEMLEQPAFTEWVQFLQQEETRNAISALGGYDTTEMGKLSFVEF
jgi:molybdate-binding protein/DNA-binding transcriptional regulator YhcF (GntR family)